MRPSRILLGVLIVTVVCTAAYRRYQASQLSPFVMWATRAGAPFTAMDAEAFHDTKSHFSCVPVAGDIKRCEIVTGVAGRMEVAVDGAGRAMIVRWRAVDSSLKLIEEARRIAAEWTLVESRQSRVEGVDGSPVTRWVTADGRWSATMSDFSKKGEPHSIVLVDERRLTRAVEGNARGVLRLAAAGMLDADQFRSAIAHAPTAMGAAARQAEADGRALATAASGLPGCGFIPGDVIAVGDDAAKAYGPDDAALLERAIARAFPGLRLVLARHAYLVDSTGAAEEVRVLPPSTDGVRVAFAISYPRRIAAINARMRTFPDSPGACRASAEIVLAQRDTAGGRLLDASRTDADADALASDVRALEFGRLAGGSTVLFTTYTASYGAAHWIGGIDWTAIVVPTASSGRVASRVPTLVGRKRGDAPELAGVVSVEGTSAAGQQLWLMLHDSAIASSRILLVAGPAGLPSGWMLLDALP